MQHLRTDSYSLMRETSSWCSRTLNRLVCDCLVIAHLMWYIRDRRWHVFYKLLFPFLGLLTFSIDQYTVQIWSGFVFCLNHVCILLVMLFSTMSVSSQSLFFLLITSQTNVTLRFFHCIWNFVWQQKMFQMSKLKYIYWASGTLFTKHP